MFEKYFIAPVFALIKQIKDCIGNPTNPTGTNISKMLFDILQSRVMRYIYYSNVTRYSTSSTSYEVVKTFTTTLPSTPTSFTSIMLYLTYAHTTPNPGSSKWEIGFGDSPSTWTKLKETSTSAYETFTETYVLDPSKYESSDIIKLRLSIKKSGTENFTFQTQTLGYIDVQYY